MKRLIPVVLLLAGILLSAGCGSLPANTKAITLYPDSGVNPDTWVRIPAGPFLKGQYNHPASIDHDYEIMVTPVTNAQYARYLSRALQKGIIRIAGGKIEGYYPGDKFNGGKHEQRITAGYHLHMDLNDPATRIIYNGKSFGVKAGYENHPVTEVTWFGAKAYADFYGYRLPTDDEWEKAARGVDGRPYPWGEQATQVNLNYYHSGDPFETVEGYSDTTPVGFYNGKKYGDFRTVDSRSPYGLYDMAGNVGEWTGDILYQVHYRDIRGGSKNSSVDDCRIWSMNNAQPEYAGPSTGFRCVRDLK